MRHRGLYAYYRYARFLEKEFRLPVAVFLALVFGGGFIIHNFYEPAKADVETLTIGTEHVGYVEGCYGVLSMIFTQNYFRFPRGWPMQAFFFLVPVIGIGAVANSLVRLGYYVFTRKQKLPEWHIMNASVMRNHMVVIGVGKVGYNIIKDLLEMREDVVAVERNMESPLVAELLDLNVPIIQGEGRLKKTLEQAGVARAKAVILATDDDLANLDAALTAREIKPDVRVVLRLFDETLATKVATTFKMPAISTSATAAPSFIAAATGRTVLAGFTMDGETQHVADLHVEPGSEIVGRTVGQIQTQTGVNIVMHKRSGQTNMNPSPDLVLAADDQVLVIAPLAKIAEVEKKL
jgi:Trk K+ transport system NAD-binding subunit